MKVAYIQYASLKMTCVFVETFPLLFCFSVITAAQKTQTQLQKIRKRSCTAFRKLICVQPSALWKKPSASSEETFWFSEEAFQFAVQAAPQTHFRKMFRMSASFFWCVPMLEGNILEDQRINEGCSAWRHNLWR